MCSKPTVLLSCQVAIYNWNVSIFGILWGIATGLGLQWTLGVINLFFLWGFGIPVTYYFALVQGGGLNAAWTWINAPYTGMNISLIILFCTLDWKVVQAKILSRENTVDDKENGGQGRSSENESLLGNPSSGIDYGARQV